MTDQPERLFFSGDSLEQAVMAAARHYQCDPDELLYERIEKRHGFIRTRRRVVIKVDPSNYRRPVPSGNRLPSPEAQLEAMDANVSRPPGRGGNGSRRTQVESSEESFVALPVDPKPLRERFPEAQGETADAAREALRRLCLLAELDLDMDVLQGEGRLEIDLTGPDAKRLREGEGRVLQALQHLVPRLMQATLGEIVPCRVDSANYQEIREEQLRDMAQRVATEVRVHQRPKTLRPMSPSDRRVVHLALADDPAVVTESLGDGYFKRVTVRSS